MCLAAQAGPFGPFACKLLIACTGPEPGRLECIPWEIMKQLASMNNSSIVHVRISNLQMREAVTGTFTMSTMSQGSDKRCGHGVSLGGAS